MRGHADLRRGNIECDLNQDDLPDVCEPLFRQWRLMISQQKSRPRADPAHDAARSAYEFVDLN